MAFKNLIKAMGISKVLIEDQLILMEYMAVCHKYKWIKQKKAT
jgi:hypothetical protein